jgi:hypothetical protein
MKKLLEDREQMKKRRNNKADSMDIKKGKIKQDKTEEI